MSERAHRAGFGEHLEQEPKSRDWRAIGVGLGAAFALIGLYGAGVWALWVVVEALA